MGVLVAVPLFKVADGIPSFGTGSEEIWQCARPGRTAHKLEYSLEVIVCTAPFKVGKESQAPGGPQTNMCPPKHILSTLKGAADAITQICE